VKKTKIEKEDLEKKIISLLSSEENGVLQKDIWKRLKIDSRIGVRILASLERKGKIIKIKKKRPDGKSYYIVKLPTKKIKILPIHLIEDLVCFSCLDATICSKEGELNPITCNKLTEWLYK